MPQSLTRPRSRLPHRRTGPRAAPAAASTASTAHSGGWYDDDAELRFRFTWRRLRPFGKALAKANLEEPQDLRRRRKRVQMDEIAAIQRRHLDEALRGTAALRTQIRQLGGQPVV